MLHWSEQFGLKMGKHKPISDIGKHSPRSHDHMTWDPSAPCDLLTQPGPLALEWLADQPHISCTIANSRKTGKGHDVWVPSICLIFLSHWGHLRTSSVFRGHRVFNYHCLLKKTSEFRANRKMNVCFGDLSHHFILSSGLQKKRGLLISYKSSSKEKMVKQNRLKNSLMVFWSNNWKIFGLVVDAQIIKRFNI